VIVTKVGYAYGPHPQSLSAKRIAEAIEGSLRRLRTDYVDVYLSHLPDPATPIEETLGAYDGLVKAGKVRAIGASNYSAAQLREALRAARSGLPRYAVLEPEYNLYDRAGFEQELRDLCVGEGLGVIPYFSLAAGFLTGKYRTQADVAGRPRERMLGKYFDERGLRILAALDGLANAHGVEPAAIALAWLMAREGVTAPIASATSVEQLDGLARAATLDLSTHEIEALDRASAV
jgi:aryl-alcohol dehydrogenase-like predicted oxidoreductase